MLFASDLMAVQFIPFCSGEESQMEDDDDVYPYVAEGDVFAPAQLGYIVV